MATQTLELEPDAFWRMVTEEHLQVDGPSAGYMWTGKRGQHGWETYKVRAQPIGWLYQARRTSTQANVGGGAQIIDIAIPTGVTARLVSCSARNSGTAALAIVVYDEDAAANPYMSQLASVSSAAANSLYTPSIGQAAVTTGNLTNSVGLILGPGQLLTVFQTGAGAQNDTLTVSVTLLMSANTEPTWSKARSTNAADVTLAASTISTANTMQAVYL